MKQYIKIYTGTTILVNRLAFLLKEIYVPYIIKDHKKSGVLGGFGTLGYSSELFILNISMNKASYIIEKFIKETS